MPTVRRIIDLTEFPPQLARVIRPDQIEDITSEMNSISRERSCRIEGISGSPRVHGNNHQDEIEGKKSHHENLFFEVHRMVARHLGPDRRQNHQRVHAIDQ